MQVEVRITPSDRYLGLSGTFNPDRVSIGEVVDYKHAVTVTDGMIDRSSCIVVVTDDGRFLFANPSQVTVMGSPEQLRRADRYAELLTEENASVPEPFVA